MVISHILDIYSLADRRPDGWTVKADGDASEIPKRRIVRPVVGSRVGNHSEDGQEVKRIKSLGNQTPLQRHLAPL